MAERKKKPAKRAPPKKAAKNKPAKKAPSKKASKKISPKKAPPKKLRRSPRRRVGRPTKTEVIPPPSGSRLALRRLAGTLYITDVVYYRSTQQLADLEMFADIPPSVIADWCQKDKWVEQRRKFEALVKQRAEKQIADKLVLERREEIKKAHKLYNDAVDILQKKGRPEPKTYEGMVTAVVRLGQYLETMRSEVLGDLDIFAPPPVVEGEPEADAVHKVPPKLSVREAQAAIDAILEVRRTEQREEHGIVDEADPTLLEG